MLCYELLRSVAAQTEMLHYLTWASPEFGARQQAQAGCGRDAMHHQLQTWLGCLGLHDHALANGAILCLSS